MMEGADAAVCGRLLELASVVKPSRWILSSLSSIRVLPAARLVQGSSCKGKRGCRTRTVLMC